MICTVDVFEVYSSHLLFSSVLSTPLVLAHPKTFPKTYEGCAQSSRQAVNYQTQPSCHFQKTRLCALRFLFLLKILSPG